MLNVSTVPDTRLTGFKRVAEGDHNFFWALSYHPRKG